MYIDEKQLKNLLLNYIILIKRFYLQYHISQYLFVFFVSKSALIEIFF